MNITPAFNSYTEQVDAAFKLVDLNALQMLADALRDAWENEHHVFLCGNGGSAGNAIHIANDLIYGIGGKEGTGLRAEALSANQSVVTCLANDLGYDEIFSQQLRVKAEEGDVLVALSGSGNSPNIVNALQTGNTLGMKTFAILGYTGGKCKSLAQVPIHIELHDMQIAEDMQLILGHICMQYLCNKSVKVKAA